MPGFFNTKEKQILFFNWLFYWIIIPAFLIYLSVFLDAETGIYLERVWYFYPVGVLLLILSFDYAYRTTYLLKFFGDGLPVSRSAPERLVKVGLFERVRHPMYLAFIYYLLGISIFFQSVSFFAFVMPGFIIVMLLYAKISEEFFLKKRFGDEYKKYVDAVPFIIPQKRTYEFNRAPGIVYWFVYFILKIFLFQRIYKIEFKGRENIPEKGPKVFVAFHTNYFDPFLMAGGAKHYIQWVTSSFYFQGFRLRWLIEQLGCFPRKRYSADLKSIKTFMDLVKQGSAIGYFPEGARNWLGNHLDLLEPAVKLMVRAQIPVIPIKIHGGYQGWPRWSDNWINTKITIEYCEPVILDKTKTTEENIQELYKRMELEDLWEVETFQEKNSIKGLHRVIWECPECQKEESFTLKARDIMICRNCGTEIKLTKDFKVLIRGKDKKEEKFTIPKIYEFMKERLIKRKRQLKEIPVKFEKFLIQKENETEWKEIFNTNVVITNEKISISGEGLNSESNLKDLTYVTVEKNFILQFKIGGYFVRLFFIDDVLKWYTLLETPTPI
ncbi:MAG: 1-acyl-sn-glycerol-3-phosphate acyltransferase [bacterium]|nr:1-acyl-sn-glycerol-3-phosphate acyltransferase [bacterium]